MDDASDRSVGGDGPIAEADSGRDFRVSADDRTISTAGSHEL